jgi:hypothetical protein
MIASYRKIAGNFLIVIGYGDMEILDKSNIFLYPKTI